MCRDNCPVLPCLERILGYSSPSHPAPWMPQATLVSPAPHSCASSSRIHAYRPFPEAPAPASRSAAPRDGLHGRSLAELARTCRLASRRRIECEGRTRWPTGSGGSIPRWDPSSPDAQRRDGRRLDDGERVSRHQPSQHHRHGGQPGRRSDLRRRPRRCRRIVPERPVCKWHVTVSGHSRPGRSGVRGRLLGHGVSPRLRADGLATSQVVLCLLQLPLSARCFARCSGSVFLR